MIDINQSETINYSDPKFNRKKRRYFQLFALKHRGAIGLHKEFGLITRPEGWRNVSRHCLLQAVAMDVIADTIGLSGKDKANLVTAAFIHDFNKKNEIALLKKEGDSLSTYEKDEEESARIMQTHGYSPEVIKIVDAIGITKMDRVMDPSCTLPEKIMFLVDASTDDEEIVGARKKTLHMRSKHPEINALGTYDELDLVTDHLQAELAARLGLDNPSQLFNWINEQIVARIMGEEATDLAGNTHS